MQTTVGQLMLREALPRELSGGGPRVLDKAGVKRVMEELTALGPDVYRDTTKRLYDLGALASHASGSSFGVADLTPPPEVMAERNAIRKKVIDIVNRDDLTDDQREELIKSTVFEATSSLEKNLYDLAVKNKNPYAIQVLSGSRGGKSDMRSLMVGDMLVSDHRDRVIPVPVLNSYGEGLDPAEYWAGSYGARKGSVCLRAGTLVRMADWSVRPIEAIRPGDFVMGADSSGHCFPAEVVRCYDNGLRPCYRYLFHKNKCESTVTLESTEAHRVLAQIREGRPGSTYAYRSVYTSAPLPMATASLRADSRKNTFSAMPCLGVRVAGSKPEGSAVLLGVMLGDGCMARSTRGRYLLSCADPLLVRDLMSEVLPGDVGLRKEKGSNYNWSFTGGGVARIFNELRTSVGEKLAHDKQLPDLAGMSDADILGLLGGLFSTDGSLYARKRGVTVRLQLTSESMVLGVKAVLECRFGVYASEVDRIPKETKPHATHDQYGFSISHAVAVRRFMELVPLYGKKRVTALKLTPRISSYHSVSEYGFKIMSREWLGECHTHDIEVNTPEHLFVLANGLIVSNSTKFAVAKAGFFGKQMVQAAHRVVVTEPDCQTERGIPVDARDPDNEGAVLAAPSGTFAAGTVLTPRILSQLKDARISVRSPLTCGAGHGVCQRCAGIREKGEFPELGENIGIAAATSLTEQLSQALLGVKHGGGRAKSLKGHEEIKGYDLVNQLVQSPDNFRDEAAIAELDGVVGAITPAPQGGQYVLVGDKQHFVPEGSAVTVKTGQRVDAGDILSEGIPHPSKLVRYRGLGAGRLAFVDEFRKAYKNEGLKANRRNIEILARGLVNHVRVNDLDGPQSSLPDDVLEYQTMERDYQPRVGTLAMRPKLARGMYLEQPAAHYTIGTRVTQRVADDLDAQGVPEIMAHSDTPSFEPEMVRAMENLTNSPDWQVRMGGSYLGKGLQEAVHRGRTSQRGESYIPGLAEGKDFGRKLETEGIY